jgi:hypothetical protein
MSSGISYSPELLACGYGRMRGLYMPGGSMVLNSRWVRGGGPPGSAVAGMNAD